MTRIEKCLNAYDHVLRVYQMINDNYFKRTQILMIVAQSALFVAFVKLFTGTALSSFRDPLLAKRIVLLVIAGLGILAAYMWWLFISRQCNTLNLCKTYLRAIESSLMQLGVPSGYWTYESMTSYPDTYKKDPRLCILHKATWLFPCWLFKPSWLSKRETKRLKIRLTKLERWIAIGLGILWFLLAVVVFLSWWWPFWTVRQPSAPILERLTEFFKGFRGKI